MQLVERGKVASLKWLFPAPIVQVKLVGSGNNTSHWKKWALLLLYFKESKSSASPTQKGKSASSEKPPDVGNGSIAEAVKLGAEIKNIYKERGGKKRVISAREPVRLLTPSECPDSLE